LLRISFIKEKVWTIDIINKDNLVNNKKSNFYKLKIFFLVNNKQQNFKELPFLEQKKIHKNFIRHI